MKADRTPKAFGVLLPENKFVMKMANKDVMKTENSNA